jgi:hypothetical protein
MHATHHQELLIFYTVTAQKISETTQKIHCRIATEKTVSVHFFEFPPRDATKVIQLFREGAAGA